MLKGFKDFISRGNAIDLAVGVVIGAAFGTVITAVVDGFINPIVGAVLPSAADDLASMYWTIGGAKLQLGMIASTLIAFIATAFAVYVFVVVPMNAWAQRREQDADEEPTNDEKMIALLERIAEK